MFSTPLHPMFVHFPLALFISAWGIGVVSRILRKDSLFPTAVHMYVLAALTTPIAVLTGLWEEQHLHLAHPVLSLHKTFALLLMSSSLLSLLVLWLSQRVSPRHFRTAFFIFAMLMTIFVCITAFYGGKLVFEYAVGVEL